MGGARAGLTAIATFVVLMALGAPAAGEEGPDPSLLAAAYDGVVGSEAS